MNFIPLIISIAVAHGISPKLLIAIVEQESGFRNGVVSRTGDLGLVQMSVSTAKEIGCADNLERLRWDAEYNLRCGAKYLSRLKKRYGHEPNWWSSYHSRTKVHRTNYYVAVKKRMIKREMASVPNN